MSDHECPQLVEGSASKFKIQTQKENKETERDREHIIQRISTRLSNRSSFSNISVSGSTLKGSTVF